MLSMRRVAISALALVPVVSGAAAVAGQAADITRTPGSMINGLAANGLVKADANGRLSGTAVSAGDIANVLGAPPLLTTGGTLSSVETFAAPAALDLTFAGTPNPTASKLTTGNSVSFCPALSCINTPGDTSTVTPSFFDHQRASALFSAVTSDDGHSEEQTLAVTTSIGTGYHKPYAASTAYSVNDNIVVGNAVYRAVVAGTTGANSAPPGTRPTAAQGGNARFADGSVTWQWINDASIDSKVGLYVETQVLPGAGQAWNAAFNYHLKTQPLAGMFLPGVEFDYSNDSGTACALGVTDCTAMRIALGGASITEGVQITGNTSGTSSSIWALRINGDAIASQSAIEVDAASPVGLGFGISGIGGASHSIATIQDATTSPASLALGGANSLAAIYINPPSGGSARALQTNGKYATSTWEDDSSSPTAINLGGTYSIAALVFNAPTGGSSMPRGQQFNGNYASSVLEDNSTSPAMLNIGGKHSIAAIVDASTSQNGIALNGTYSGSQIVGKGFNFDPNGTLTLSGGAAPNLLFPSTVGGAGTINKIALYGTSYGLGISAGSLDHVVPANGANSFYTGTTKVASVDANGFEGPIGLGAAAAGAFTNISMTGSATFANTSTLRWNGTAAGAAGAYTNGTVGADILYYSDGVLHSDSYDAGKFDWRGGGGTYPVLMSLNPSGLTVSGSASIAGQLTLPGIASAAPSGTVKGAVCMDSNGVLYVNTNSGTCK